MSAQQRREDHTIYPTKKCFDDSLELMTDMVQQTPNWERRDLIHNLHLVHAIVEPGGRRSSHAWVEHDDNDMAYFVGIRNGKRVAMASPRGDYRRLHNVVEMVRYKLGAVYLMNRTFGTFGPWEERFQQLCGNGDDVVRIEGLPAVQVSE